MASRSGSARIVPAVDRAARILSLLESQLRPMSITELAEQLDVSKGTVREILETLRHHGLLDRNEETKRYFLGSQLARLGAATRESHNLVIVARPLLQALSDKVRENVLLLVVQDDQLLIQDACQPRDPNAMIIVAATPGRTMPLMAGACGKVVMVWGDETAQARVAAANKGKRAMSQAELKRTAKRGYAVDDQEYLDGVRAACAPLLDTSNRIIALILVSGIAASLSRDRLHEVGQAVQATAVEVRERLLPAVQRQP